MIFDEKMLKELQNAIESTMSPKRFRHTVAVADMAVRLGRLYAPDKLSLLAAAGLLHDITKEYTTERQIEIFRENGIFVTKEDILSPKTFHARTAVLLIPRLYPAFADPELLSAVRYHTTGRAGMSMTERIVYFADYIDDTRTFEDCVLLRRLFWDANPAAMEQDEREEHFRRLLILSFDKTLSALIAEGGVISGDTLAARNSLILEA